MCISVGHSEPGAGAFVACDTALSMTLNGVFVRRFDVGGRLQSTGSGWATAAGDRYGPCHVALAALRDAGAVQPDANPAERASRIVSAALSAKGFEPGVQSSRQGAFIIVIEPSVDLICLENGVAESARYAASFPIEFSDDEGEGRSQALSTDITNAGPDIESRIRAVAKHFAEIQGDVRTVSPVMECGFIIPTTFGPARGFIRGDAREIAGTPPQYMLERFWAAPTARLPWDVLVEQGALGHDPREISPVFTPATGYRVKPDFALNNAGGSTQFGINRHNDQKSARDSSGTQTFGVTFDNVPQMRAIPQSVQSFKAASSGVDQRLDVRAINITVSTFDPRAKLVTGGTSTPATDTWATTLNGTPAASRTIQNPNAAVFADLASANGLLTTYTARFDVNTAPMNIANTLFVSLYKNNGTGSTSWTLVASRSYNANQTLTNETLAFAAAMTLDWDVRIVITYQTTPLTLEKATVVARDVTYNVLTGSSAVDATGNTDDAVIYQAMEAP